MSYAENTKRQRRPVEQVLLDLIVEGKPAQEACDELSFCLGNPLIIIDSNFQILYAARKEAINDPIWLANLSQGYCSFEFICEIKKLESFIRAPTDQEAFFMTCSGSPIRRLVSKIFLQKELWGYAVLLESLCPFQNADSAALRRISEVYGSVYAVAKHNDSDIITQTYIDIIEDEISDELTLRNRLRAWPKRAEFPLGMVLVDFSLYDGLTKPERYLENQLNSFFPSACIFLYESMIVLIMPAVHFQAQKRSANLQRFVKEQNLFLVSCNPTENWGTLQTNFQEGLFFAEHIRDLNDNPGMYDVEWMKNDKFYLMHSPQKLETFICRAVKRLSDFDLANNTNYCDMYQTFIDNRYNKSKAAQALYLHRNTLQYHLNKIMKISGIDSDDASRDLEIAQSLRLRRYIIRLAKDKQMETLPG